MSHDDECHVQRLCFRWPATACQHPCSITQTRPVESRNSTLTKHTYLQCQVSLHGDLLVLGDIADVSLAHDARATGIVGKEAVVSADKVQ